MGRLQTEETRRRISRANIGKCHTDESKEKMRKVHLGKKMSLESRKKMSEWRKGKKLSKQHRKNVSIALKGRVLSEEHKKNLRKPRCKPRSEEHCRKLGIALKKVWNKDEYRVFARDRCISMIQKGILGRSSFEDEVEILLMNNKLKFEKQVRLGDFVCDFFIEEKGIVIEVDGEYWHKNKYIDCVNPAQKRNFVYRKKKIKYLNSVNIHIVEINESNVDKLMEVL